MNAPQNPAEARAQLAAVLAELEAAVSAPGRWTTELFEKRDAWAIGIESRIARWDDALRTGLRAADVLRAKALAVGALDDFAARVRTPAPPEVKASTVLGIRDRYARWDQQLDREDALRKAQAAEREDAGKKGAA